MIYTLTFNKKRFHKSKKGVKPMRAIMILFDTLNRNYLPNYGNAWVHAPNFKRLADHCVTFDNFYAGSMPCMPARRELHTGKYNFPFRGWGPLEPFDFSVFETLKENGIYTHLVTDHDHYFEDGGATYHNRYTTWEGFRGQEGDRWVPQDLALTNQCPHPLNKTGISVTQHYANRTRQRTEAEMSSVRTASAGIEYLKAHGAKDNFCLQIECFDPHEPFYAPQKYRDLYHCLDEGGIINWPAYQAIEAEKNQDSLAKLHKEYAALISMCDAQLGKILDVMDELDMWKDTLLIVNTDHGFLLGEHDYIGKNFPPAYQELAQLPFFIHDPRSSWAEKRCDKLAQTVDIAPTLLDFFGVGIPKNMEGKSLLNILEKKTTNHETILFGVYGGHLCIFDGRYLYMRSDQKDKPLYAYTLMPTNMRGYFKKNELKAMELFSGNKFTNGLPCLKIPVEYFRFSSEYGNLLFNISEDPYQQKKINDPDLESNMIQKLVKFLKSIDATKDIFERYDLPL
jgi:arylsulfatase A-like enzyme